MKRYKEKNNLVLLIIVLFVLTVGIGYAVLSEQLTINNTISYGPMNWDVGFTAVEDGYEAGIDAYGKMLETKFGYTFEEFGYTREEINELIEEQLLGNLIL